MSRPERISSPAPFDLEKAVREWRMCLLKSPGLEESHVVEIEEGLRDEIEDLVGAGMSEEEAFRAATAEKASAETIGREFHKVRTRRRSGRPFWEAPRGTSALLASFLKIAWRRIRRHKGYAFLNIAGLALGMACVLLILLYVRHETSYDRCHPDADRTFRVASQSHIRSVGMIAAASSLLAPALQAEFPEVESSLRLRRSGMRFVRTGQRVFKETRLFCAEAGVFDLLSVRLVAGNPGTALTGPDRLILSERTAKKYFGGGDPLGQKVVVSETVEGLDGAAGRVLTVTGVFRDMPSNTHFHADLISSFPAPRPSSPDEWSSLNSLTYFRAKQGTNLRDLQAKVQALVDARSFAELETSLGKEKAAARFGKTRDKIFFQPLVSIHLRPNLWDELEPGGNILYISGLSIVAALILAVAGVNFVNLATARAGTRALEVGIRKTAGSSRSLLVRQFMAETTLLTGLAFLLALAAAGLGLPFFNGLTGLHLTLKTMAAPGFLAVLLGVFLLVSFLAGLYPAFVLSSAHPAAVLKGRSSRNQEGRRLKKILVVFQFTVSLVLMTGSFLVSKQLRYIRGLDPGFSKERILLVQNLNLLGGRASAFKQEILRCPDVQNVSLTNNPPVRPDTVGMLSGVRLSDEAGASRPVNCSLFMVDEDYVPTLGMEIVRGRNFSGSMPADSSAVLINETAAKAFGLEDPLGRRFSLRLAAGDEMPSDPTAFTVIGVVKDFHFSSLRKAIEPLLLFNQPRHWFAAVRLRTDHPQDALDFIRGVWDRFVPGLPLEYSYLDEGFEALYRTERTTGRILGSFAALALLVGCLGLFGLAAFTAEQRTKEIGIRKVLGAAVVESAALLVKEFVLLVAAAGLFAAPLSLFLMNMWLGSFTCRVNIGVTEFAAAALLALFVALATVLYQALKAALAEPSKSLRYE